MATNWKDRDMCEPYLNENEEESPFLAGGPFWEVTFRTSWTDEKGTDENDTFESRRELAGENAVGFLLDYFFKEVGPFAFEYASGETTELANSVETYQTINCREYHEVFNPPPDITEFLTGKVINLPMSAKEAYYIPGMGENDNDNGHFLESGDQGKLLFHVKIAKSYIDSWAMVPEMLQDMRGESPFAIVLKLQKIKEDIDFVVDTIFPHYTQKMKEAEADGFEFNFDLNGLGTEMKKFPKAISDYLIKVSPYVCDWDAFENGIDTTYDDKMEIGFNGDLTISYVACATDPKRHSDQNQSAEPGETPAEKDKWIAVPSRVGIRCFNMTVPFDNARIINLLMRVYSMTEEKSGT
jgi:hypothetical protein